MEDDLKCFNLEDNLIYFNSEQNLKYCNLKMEGAQWFLVTLLFGVKAKVE